MRAGLAVQLLHGLSEVNAPQRAKYELFVLCALSVTTMTEWLTKPFEG